MGGKSFTQPGPDGEPTLDISRLSHQAYMQLQKRVTDVLKSFYERVTVPAEAPEKLDHGDIDFLVQTPLRDFDRTELHHALGAVRSSPPSTITNFAIPFSDHDGVIKFAQVDVSECKGNITWLAFLHSYGDLWQILGTIVRPHGLTVNDKGISVRVREGESIDRPASLIPLTDDPPEVCSLLNLNYDVYRSGFPTVTSVFDWIAACPLLEPTKFVTTAHEFRERNLQTRPMFRRFVEAYLPALPSPSESTDGDAAAATVITAAPPTREGVVDDALRRFGKRDEYEAKVRTFVARKRDAKAAAHISRILKDCRDFNTQTQLKKLNMIIRAVRRRTELVDGALRIRDDEAVEVVGEEMALGVLLTEDEEMIEERHELWLREHWEEVLAVEKARVKDAKEARKRTSL